MSSKGFDELMDDDQAPAPELDDFVSGKLRGNKEENYLLAFWDANWRKIDFTPGHYGKDLINNITLKINNPHHQKEWDQRDYGKDIDELTLPSQFSTYKVEQLKGGYGNALFRLAKITIYANLKKKCDKLQDDLEKAEEKHRAAEELRAAQASSTATSPRKRGMSFLKKPDVSHSQPSSPMGTPTPSRKRATSIFGKKKDLIVVNPELKTIDDTRVALAATQLKLSTLDEKLEEIRLIAVDGKAPQPMAKDTSPNKKRSQTKLGARTVHKIDSEDDTSVGKRSTIVVPVPVERKIKSPDHSRDDSDNSRGFRVGFRVNNSYEEDSASKSRKPYSPGPSPRATTHQSPRHTSEDDHSTVVEEVPPLDRCREILLALSTGDEQEMNRVQEKYYPKKEGVQKAFSEFAKEYPSFLSVPPLIREDTPEISSALVEVFEHLIALHSENETRKKMSGFYFFRKSPEPKIRELAATISYFLKPNTTLKQVKARLDSKLCSISGMDLLENRGPLGAYFIISAIKGEKNNVNHKYVNSTMESKLLKLHGAVTNIVEAEYGSSYVF